MSNLHTLNRGPADSALFKTLSDAVTAGDALLLIEDGVYWSLPAFQTALSGLGCGTIYVLKPDAEARGVDQATWPLVDDAEFVNLVTQHKLTLSWF